MINEIYTITIPVEIRAGKCYGCLYRAIVGYEHRLIKCGLSAVRSIQTKHLGGWTILDAQGTERRKYESRDVKTMYIRAAVVPHVLRSEEYKLPVLLLVSTLNHQLHTDPSVHQVLYSWRKVGK